MPVYNLEKLMEETRRIASEYRQSTGSTLPVSAELAKYDAIRLLGLKTPPEQERAVDAWMITPGGDRKVQIKGRVIFDPEKSGHRVGQLNLDADWDILVLVIMNDQYETQQIYRVSRDKLVAALPEGRDNSRKLRGAISVKKVQAISDVCWPTG